MSNTKLNIIIGRSLLVLLVAGAFVLLLGAVRSKEDKVCSGLQIQIGITSHKGFVDEKEVATTIRNETNSKVKGTPIKQFNLRATESVLEKNVWIKKAQMYFDNNEVLHVEVEQRIPVVRIMDKSGAAYYLDSTGFSMPLSNTDRADVPVFTNVPVKRSAKLQRTILDLALYIDNDSFWLAQAAQINLLSKERFELYPSFGDHVVDLGDGLNPEDKLGRLKLFYKTVSAKKGFDAYTKLSVAYSRQVIAIKGKAITPRVDAGRAMQVFDQMVKTNRRTANEDREQEAYNPNSLKDPDAGNKSINNASEQPPDAKNKGNPPADEQDATEKKPKAVMPKFKHN